MEEPTRVRVVGRLGAGRRTVAGALRAAGIAVVQPRERAAVDEGAEAGVHVDVYVFVETLNSDDRAALAASARPTVAVLNKVDLVGFPDGGPVSVAEQCARLRRETGVPVRPVSALLAVAATDPGVLNDATLAALRRLAAGGVLDDGARHRLAARLDVLGTALAVAALREGAGRAVIADLLSAASGIGDVLVEIDRAGAAERYLGAVGAARVAAAVAVLDAVGAPAPRSKDPLGRAVHWYRYARGPVSAMHRACALDSARAALRLWARAGGPGALP